MKNSLLAFLTLLLIASCSADSVPDKNEFQQKKIGNWTITSPDDAEFSGTRNIKNITPAISSADTIIVTDPQGFGMTLEYAPTELRPALILFTYSDSLSVGWPDITDISMKINATSDFPTLSDKSRGIGINLAEIAGEITYPCFATAEDVGDIEARYDTADSTHTVVIIKSEGFVDVLDEIRDC